MADRTQIKWGCYARYEVGFNAQPYPLVVVSW